MANDLIELIASIVDGGFTVKGGAHLNEVVVRILRITLVPVLAGGAVGLNFLGGGFGDLLGGNLGRDFGRLLGGSFGELRRLGRGQRDGGGLRRGLLLLGRVASCEKTDSEGEGQPCDHDLMMLHMYLPECLIFLSYLQISKNIPIHYIV